MIYASPQRIETLDLTVIIEREAEPEAGYGAYCPSVPGCYSNGFSFEEALANIQEALEQHLQALLTQRGVLSIERRKVRVEELVILLKK